MPQTTLPENPTPRNAHLDGIRGAAALFVVAFHLVAMRNESFAGGMALGVCGVDLFFLLSGGLILPSLDRCSARSFLSRRAIRIYPCLVVSVVASWGLNLWISGLTNQPPPDLSFLEWLANLSGLSTMFSVLPLEGPHWTLVAEIQFYCIAALLGLVPAKVRTRLTILLLLAEFLLLVLLTGTSTKDLLFRFPVLGLWHLFLAGSILAKPGKLSIPDTCLIAACLVAGWLSWPVCGRTRFYVTQPAAMLVLIAFVIAIRYAFRVEIRFPALLSVMLDWIARISYPLYLFHQTLGLFLISWFCYKGITLPIATLSAIACVISTAWAMERICDRYAVAASRKLAA